ncbi:MAG: oxygen-independent coproporphyrinogen III oxidase [Lachnospiraceae bacterium]|nr:oxygen-independent coproporphyrinogen III oxidase [Lachnospiraceae bacterium]
MDRMKLSIYIHIPFCKKKCRYCDFLSFEAEEDLRKRYVEGLLEEIRLQALNYRHMEADTLFFGGGTPSCISAELLGTVMEEIRKNFSISPDAEISMEVNPGTADLDKLEKYRKMGINRLSIGAQSMQPEELKLLGRIHGREEFLECYIAAREAGFANISIDLMSALPGQTWNSFYPTLREVVALQPEHLSVYSLIIEEGTPFFEKYGDKEGAALLPSEEEDRKIYHETYRFLKQSGYHRYELSNYAKPGFECKHNLGYWSGKNYVGFGLGAASMVEGVRWKNTSSMEAYLAGEARREDEHRLTLQERMEEYMFLGLRKTKGVSVSGFFELFGTDMDVIYGPWIEKMKKNDLLCGTKYLALTTRGQDLANYVMAGFLQD